ncbi:hypothetical protein Trydic_g15612 [Trypoxylus dichotomus]
MFGCKRKVLTLDDKVVVINAIESGRKKADVCRQFGLVNSTVGTIIKNKEKILKSFDEGGAQAKKIRLPEKPDVDSALIKWFSQCRSANLPINGPLLMKKAEEFGRLLGDSEFKCSDGWLHRFKLRHGISFGKINGEAKIFNLQDTEKWLTNMWPRLREGYKDEDIFNADETGFFYKLLPDMALKYKHEKCIGGKLAKERLTVLVCANIPDAVEYLAKAWYGVTATTIANSFRHAKLSTKEVSVEEDDEFSIPLSEPQGRCQKFGTNEWELDTFEVEEYANIDYNLITSDVYSDADIVELVKNGNGELGNLNDEEEKETSDLEIAAPTNQEVHDAVQISAADAVEDENIYEIAVRILQYCIGKGREYLSIFINTPRIHDEPQKLWSEESVMGNEGSSSNESDADDSGSECEMSELCRVNQEIWNESSIWDELHELQGSEDIFELIQKNTIEDVNHNKYYGKAGLIISCWQGKDKFAKYFLEKGADSNCMDSVGRTPLHFAASSGAVECVKLLVEHGATVSKWDREHKATPLHCAANKGHLCCLKYLIKNGADVNAGLTQKTPLHFAVQSEAVECVRELLDAGAVPNTPQVFSEAPIHIAASIGASEILKLLIIHGASVRVQCGAEKSTALHLAAADGDVECVKILLDAGADINARNNKLQTALHTAALSQSTEILEVLLKRGADPNVVDANGRTPLHGAIVKFTRTCEPAKLLLNAGANVNKPDIFGYTPLHLAALNEFSQSAMLLLSYGGDMTAKTNGGVSVLTFITRRTPDVIPKFISKLDSSIKLNDHEIGDVDCEYQQLVFVGLNIRSSGGS